METLELAGKGLSVASGIVIAKLLEVNAVLTNLNLAGNELNAEAGKAIAEALKSGTAVLKSIDLRGNSLGTEGWCAIFAALRDNKENTIEAWDLSYEGISSEVAKVLAEYVSLSKVLKSLNVADNELGNVGERALRDAANGRDGCELML